MFLSGQRQRGPVLIHRVSVRSGGPDEDAGGGVPAPGGGRGEVSAANPAVQAQQGDPVLPAVKDPLARAGQPERQPGEGAGVAQRRGRRQGVAVLRLDQPGRAGAAAGVAAPAAMACSARRSVPDRPSPGAGNSSSSRSSAGPRKGSPGWSARAASASADGSGWRRAAQTETAAASVSRLAGIRAGQSVSSSSAVSSPSPRKAGLDRK